MLFRSIIVARSAGAKIASQFVDSLPISKIICLGYPFKHPNKNIETDRYVHLQTIKTPMLIIQGDKDEYGGTKIKDNYQFSRSVELFFINGNHDFNLNTQEWKQVLQKITDYL